MKRWKNFVEINSSALTANGFYRAAMICVVLFYTRLNLLVGGEFPRALNARASDLRRLTATMEIAVAFIFTSVRLLEVFKNVARVESKVFEVAFGVVEVDEIRAIKTEEKFITLTIFFPYKTCSPATATFAALFDSLAAQLVVVFRNCWTITNVARLVHDKTRLQKKQKQNSQPHRHNSHLLRGGSTEDCASLFRANAKCYRNLLHNLKTS